MTTAVPVAVRLRRFVRSLMFVMWALALVGPLLMFGQHLLNERISSRYSPAIDNAHHLLQEMLGAQSDLRLFHEMRKPDAIVVDFGVRQTAVRRLVHDLREAVEPNSHDADLVDRMDVATETWWAEADQIERLISEGANADITSPRSDFSDFTAANTEYTDGLESGRERLRDVRRNIFIGGFGLAVIATTAATLYARRIQSWETEAIVAPVQALDTVVARQRAGDEDVHADVYAGPTEVRNLATELNSLLDQTRTFQAEQAQLNAAQAENLSKLEDLDRQKDAFLSTVSHELRTPLTSIAGYSEMISSGDAGPLSDEQGRLIEVIDRNTRRLQGLIEDMLILTRIEAADFSPSREALDLSRIAAIVVEDLAPSALRKNITVTVEAPTAAPVEGDPNHLERALTNLVGNALKFTPEGGTVVVAVELVKDGLTPDGRRDERAVATVTDSGIGIPDAQSAELFGRFFRATNAVTASIPGTGLGLSIVQAIVEEHGGTISVTSHEGEGASARVDLPAVTRNGGPGPNPGPSPGPSSA